MPGCIQLWGLVLAGFLFWNGLNHWLVTVCYHSKDPSAGKWFQVASEICNWSNQKVFLLVPVLGFWRISYMRLFIVFWNTDCISQFEFIALCARRIPTRFPTRFPFEKNPVNLWHLRRQGLKAPPFRFCILRHSLKDKLIFQHFAWDSDVNVAPVSCCCCCRLPEEWRALCGAPTLGTVKL